MTIQLAKGITENLRFLCVEVDSQVANLATYFISPSQTIARRVLDRSGYAYNLKTRIHNSSVQSLTSIKDDDPSVRIHRSAEIIATDLERITEYCRESLKQLGSVADIKHLRPESFEPMLARIRDAIACIEPAINQNNTNTALDVGQALKFLEGKCGKLKSKYVDDLKKKNNTEDLICGLYVVDYILQMGETLRHISEAIISANLGQQVNFDRYFSMQALVGELDKNTDDLQMETIAETRSGSMISGISDSASKDDYVAIYKDGIKRKVKEEKQGVKSWHEIYPGLAPRILFYRKKRQSAALLIEHLPGLTFEQILLNEPSLLLEPALDQLGRTLKSVWQETYTCTPVSAKFTLQLENRLDEVYKIHPEFKQSDVKISGFEIPALEKLLKKAKHYEQDIPAPFSVYIHGDFNLDNIIYDPAEKKINFIDLHRSRYMDYVQDVSVFMVSNYRLQIMDRQTRRRIMETALQFHEIVSTFAKKNKDLTFQVRLALGLARSFATSTRFILDKSLAQSMFMRARYLIESVLACPISEAEKFNIPLQEIFID